MTLKEIIEQLEGFQAHHQVIAMTESGDIISSHFQLNTCPIHSNMFSIYGNIICDINNYTHVINNKRLIQQLKTIPYESTKTGYKGQEIDYVEPEDRILLFTNSLRSIYCGKYKYLSPYHIFKDQTDKTIILCKGN